MPLLSTRIGLLDTENAFTIGPKIRAIESQDITADPQRVVVFPGRGPISLPQSVPER
ncbi:MAG: hypothetical protein NT005_11535 [Spirochaetes bacterium]|nr:hypothetical protein [Spirochaetota bacterium]